MGKSQRLRLRDVRAVYRLVGECRELGADALTWRTHLANEMCRITGARVVLTGEVEAPAAGSKILGRDLQIVDVGWVSARGRLLFLQYLQQEEYERDPATRCFHPRYAQFGTYSREQIVADRAWYNSALFNEYLTVAEIDDTLFSYHVMPGAGGNVNGLILCRPLGEHRHARRHCHMIELCQEEISRLAGGALATARDPSVSRLSPRLRQVLGSLLEGDSEKQVARRFGLRPDTVREYVAAVYRHFGVGTRAELLACFIRRSGLRLPDPGPGDKGGTSAKT